MSSASKRRRVDESRMPDQGGSMPRSVRRRSSSLPFLQRQLSSSSRVCFRTGERAKTPMPKVSHAGTLEGRSSEGKKLLRRTILRKRTNPNGLEKTGIHSPGNLEPRAPAGAGSQQTARQGVSTSPGAAELGVEHTVDASERLRAAFVGGVRSAGGWKKQS